MRLQAREFESRSRSSRHIRPPFVRKACAVYAPGYYPYLERHALVSITGSTAESGIGFTGDASLNWTFAGVGAGALFVVQWVSTSITLTQVSIAGNSAALPIGTPITQGGGRSQLAYASNITDATGAKACTTSFSSGGGSLTCQLMVIEVGGQNTTDMLDNSDTNTGSGTIASTITPATANCSIFGLALTSGGPVTLTPISSPLTFTNLPINDLNNQCDLVWTNDAGSSGAAKSYGWTDSANFVINGATLKPSGGGGGPVDVKLVRQGMRPRGFAPGLAR